MPPAPLPTTHLSRGCVSHSPRLLQDRTECDVEVGVSACWVQLCSGNTAFLWDQPDSTSSGPCCGTVQLSEVLQALADTSLPGPSREPTLLRLFKFRMRSRSPPTSPMPSSPWLHNPAFLFSLFSVSSTQLACPFLSALAHTASHQSTVPWPFPYSKPSSKITSWGSHPDELPPTHHSYSLSS